MHTVAKNTNNERICFREDSDGQFTVTENGLEEVYVSKDVAIELFWRRAVPETLQVTTTCLSCGC